MARPGEDGAWHRFSQHVIRLVCCYRQVGELQKALQMATTRMLSLETSPGTPPAAAQFAAAARRSPDELPRGRHPEQPSAGGLYAGLSLDTSDAAHMKHNSAAAPSASVSHATRPAASTRSMPVPPTTAVTEQPGGSGAQPVPGGMFSGLDLVADGTSVAPSPALPSLRDRSSSIASSDAAVVNDGMRGDNSRSGSTTGPLRTAGSAVEALAELLSPPLSPHAGALRCLGEAMHSSLQSACLAGLNS